MNGGGGSNRGDALDRKSGEGEAVSLDAARALFEATSAAEAALGVNPVSINCQ